MSKVLQIRLDDDLKEKSDATFAQMGLDAPTAVRLFLTRVVQTGEIPFKISIFPDEVITPELQGQIDAAMSDPEKIGPFDTMKEALSALNK